MISSALFSRSSEGAGGGRASAAGAPAAAATEGAAAAASEAAATEGAAAAASEAAAVEAFVREAPSLSRLAVAASEADADLRALEGTLSGFRGSLGTISSDIRGLQSASAALARRLAARRAAAAALAGALDALALPPQLVRAVSEGDPSSPEFAAALADLARRMRKFSGRDRGKTGGGGKATSSLQEEGGKTPFPLRASRAAEEVLT